MKDSIAFFQSRNIHDYKEVLVNLQNDFSQDHWEYILTWCKVIDNDAEDFGKFWEVWLIEAGSRKVGICGLYSLKHHDTRELWLGWFGVLKPYRRSGIGSAAIDFMETEARRVGCRRLISYIQKGPQPLTFYKSNGFSEYPIFNVEVDDPQVMYISKEIDIMKSDKNL